MDKFGYIRGRRGPPGPAGKDAFDMAGWTPKALLKIFRENLDGSFYFKSKTDYTIFTNNTGSKGVVISSKTINILGAQARQELTYDPTEWNSMLVQWSTVSNGEDRCFFYLNERRGFFRPQKYEEDSRDLYIGGHPKRGERGNR